MIKALPATRFWSKVRLPDPETGCMAWTAYVSPQGYGGFGITRTTSVPAHRFAYEAIHGPIPPGLQVDHTCHNADQKCRGGSGCQHRRCCNPSHLDLKTMADNVAASHNWNGNWTHCPKGHPYTTENTEITRDGWRTCIACRRARDAVRRRRQGIGPLRADFDTHCHRGHEYTPETVKWERKPNGRLSRRCTICTRMNYEKRCSTRGRKALPS